MVSAMKKEVFKGNVYKTAGGPRFAARKAKQEVGSARAL